MEGLVTQNSDQRFSLERKKAERLFVELRPSAVAYGKYRRQSRKFMSNLSGLISEVQKPWIVGSRMQKSLLFGRDYLVAYVDPAWLQMNFPHTDAVAVKSIDLVCLQSPPLVLAPKTKRNEMERSFQSILEHEFVHVNQIILGTFPDPPEGKAVDLVKNLFRVTRAEYEANLIQLVRWPELYARSGEKLGLSLDAWCAFRGYTQGMEQIIMAVKGRRIKKDEFLKFLDLLPAALPSGFRRMGMDGKLGEYCSSRVEQHVSTAIRILKAELPKTKISDPLRQCLPDAVLRMLDSQL